MTDNIHELARMLYVEREISKKSEEISRSLQNRLIKILDEKGIKSFKAINNDEDNDDSNGKKVSLIENTKVEYDLNFAKEIVPEAISKTYIVDDSNLQEFKKALKNANLSAKQVNAIVKTMICKTVINTDVISRKIDKGELNQEELSKICEMKVTSRYIKIT